MLCRTNINICAFHSFVTTRQQHWILGNTIISFIRTPCCNNKFATQLIQYRYNECSTKNIVQFLLYLMYVYKISHSDCRSVSWCNDFFFRWLFTFPFAFSFFAYSFLCLSVLLFLFFPRLIHEFNIRIFTWIGFIVGETNVVLSERHLVVLFWTESHDCRLWPRSRHLTVRTIVATFNFSIFMMR